MYIVSGCLYLSLIAAVETPFLAVARRNWSDEERSDVVDFVFFAPECSVLMKGNGGVRTGCIALEGRGKRGGAWPVHLPPQR